jgi:flagellar protein FliO/FliZ
MEPVLLALRVALSLAVVLGLLWVVQRRLGRKAHANKADGLLSVVTRRGIGQKASVVVLDVDGTRYLLGVTEQSVSVLGTSDAPVVAAGADEFARSMSAATLGRAELATITRRRPGLAPTGRLGGSILSPLVWKQAATAVRQGLGR